MTKRTQYFVSIFSIFKYKFILQLEKYNKEHGIIPETIKKEVRDLISNVDETNKKPKEKMNKSDKKLLIQNIEKEMKKAASELDFERAMELRDIMFELSTEE